MRVAIAARTERGEAGPRMASEIGADLDSPPAYGVTPGSGGARRPPPADAAVELVQGASTSCRQGYGEPRLIARRRDRKPPPRRPSKTLSIP